MTSKNPAAVALGSIRTEKKSAAARENGKRGGRPSNLAQFLRGFAKASGQSDADAHWAAYSRQLGDAEREQVERGGYEAGLREGAAYRSL